jgi:hypothetical protein
MKEIISVLNKILKNRKEPFLIRFDAINILKRIDSPEAHLVLIKNKILVQYVTWFATQRGGTADIDSIKNTALNFANKNQLKACKNTIASLVIGWKCPKK